MRKIKYIATILIMSFILSLLSVVPAFAYTAKTITINVHTNDAIMLYVTETDGTPYQLYYAAGDGGGMQFHIAEPGTYNYLVSQVYDSTDATKDYDRQEWYLSISAFDDGTEDLVFNVTISDLKTGEKVDSLTFINEEKEAVPPPPVEEETHTPRQGRSSWTVTVTDYLYEARYRLVRWFTDLFELEDMDVPMSAPGWKKRVNPETGDTLFNLFFGGIAIVSLAAAGTLYVVYKKRNKKAVSL